MFKAIVVEIDDAGHRAALKDVDDGVLPPGEVTVREAYTTINYKDGLGLTAEPRWRASFRFAQASTPPAPCWRATTRASRPAVWSCSTVEA